LPFRTDIPDIGAACEGDSDTHHDERRRFDEQFRPTRRAEKRLDEKSVKRLCGILAERGEDDRRRDDRQSDRKNGRGKRPELRSAAAGIKPKQL
jgi:hypothetical protein